MKQTSHLLKAALYLAINSLPGHLNKVSGYFGNQLQPILILP
jgi:hypothetical protein